MGGGKPAARQGDMTRKEGLDIVQGSAGVLILHQPVWPARCVPQKDSPN